jgi:hypothetical protein
MRSLQLIDLFRNYFSDHFWSTWTSTNCSQAGSAAIEVDVAEGVEASTVEEDVVAVHQEAAAVTEAAVVVEDVVEQLEELKSSLSHGEDTRVYLSQGGITALL